MQGQSFIICSPTPLYLTQLTGLDEVQVAEGFEFDLFGWHKHAEAAPSQFWSSQPAVIKPHLPGYMHCILFPISVNL